MVQFGDFTFASLEFTAMVEQVEDGRYEAFYLTPTSDISGECGEVTFAADEYSQHLAFGQSGCEGCVRFDQFYDPSGCLFYCRVRHITERVRELLRSVKCKFCWKLMNHVECK